jgi:hypothetical protein
LTSSPTSPVDVEPHQPAVGVGLIADRDPEPVQGPPVDVIAVVPGSVLNHGEVLNSLEQGIELQEGMALRADRPARGHSASAATRSGLTFGLLSTASE